MKPLFEHDPEVLAAVVSIDMAAARTRLVALGNDWINSLSDRTLLRALHEARRVLFDRDAGITQEMHDESVRWLRTNSLPSNDGSGNYPTQE